MRVLANATDHAEALADAYATRGASLAVRRQTLALCPAAQRKKNPQSVFVTGCGFCFVQRLLTPIQ